MYLAITYLIFKETVHQVSKRVRFRNAKWQDFRINGAMDIRIKSKNVVDANQSYEITRIS